MTNGILKHKLLFFILTGFFIAIGFSFHTYAEPSGPNVSCSTAVVIEYETGTILYDKKKDKPMYPASTTKIMTALLALENLDLKKNITVPPDMGPADGSAMYLLPGETFTAEELLQALMVKSANDAAVLLAREISGNVEDFAKLMNERAAEIGCQNTHFHNPNGLPDKEHTVSAYDLALISREAMHNQKFRELVSTVFLQIHATEQTPEIRYFRNTNKFLWCSSEIDYKGKSVPIKYNVVDGIKTGYTEDAGNCLVTTGEKNGIRVICVVMKNQGSEVYRNSRILLDYGFDNFRLKKLLSSNEIIGSTDIPKSTEKKLNYYVKDNYSIVENINNKDFIKKNVVLSEDLKAPIKAGELVGTCQILQDNNILKEFPLFAQNDVTSIYSIKNFINLAKSHKLIIVGALIGLLLLIFLIFLAITLIAKHRRKKRIRILDNSNLYR